VNQATFIGVLASVLWSVVVALIRSITDQVGATAGAALIYSFAAVLLIIHGRGLGLRKITPRYFIIGGTLFVSYEVCLALAIGQSSSPTQAIEVSILNYLWPPLTAVLAVFVLKKPAKWLLWPGLFCSLWGVYTVLSGTAAPDLSAVTERIASHPTVYLLAFLGAIFWSLYCVATPTLTQGKSSSVTAFFAATAIVLWTKYILEDAPSFSLSLGVLSEITCASLAIGLGYAFWNIGLQRGNVTLLAGLSYFTPVLSSVFASIYLSTQLNQSFWMGALMVSFGSILGWVATRNPNRQ